MIHRAPDTVLLAARLLMAASLLPTGIARMLNVSGFALTLAGVGVPSPNAVATAAVLVQVFGPLALILGVLPRLTGLAMAGFVAAFAALLHPYWQHSGLSAATERSFLLADLGLAGAFLMYAVTGPGAWSWQGWRAGNAARGASKTAPKTASKAGGGKAASGRVRRPAGAPARAAA